MSRSPQAHQSAKSLGAYRTAWQATMQLLREGRSFSGRERNCVYLNCGPNGRRFANVSAVTGLDFKDDGRAVGVTDWDGDGDLDLWLFNRTGPRLRLMINRVADGGTVDHQFLALRLRGTTSNRDAIGARVKLTVSDRGSLRTLVRTLSAGDAFLSQSTKWVHFGIGQADVVHDVDVVWPSGQEQSYSTLEINHRYLLVEGQQRAVPLASRSRSLSSIGDPGTEQNARPGPQQTRRMFLANRIPVPPVFDDNANSQSIQIPTPSSGRPRLLVLWASWCAPCLTELAALGDRVDDVRSAGVEVIALSVDGLNDSDRATGLAAMRAAVEKLSWPYQVKLASPSQVDQLMLLRSVAFSHDRPLEIPTSFLCDRAGNLGAVYQGVVSADQLIQDTKRLATPLGDLRQLAAPTPGRWIAPPRTLLLRAVARRFKDNGYHDAYRFFLKADAAQIEQRRTAAKSEEAQKQWNHRYANAHFNLGISLLQSGESSAAAEHFQAALEVDSEHVESLTNLGTMLAQRRQLTRAVPLLERAVKLDPDNANARLNLAHALSESKRFVEAVPHYRHVLAASPDHDVARSRLGRALLESGQLTLAVLEFRQLWHRDAPDIRSGVCLAWLYATATDPSLRDGAKSVEISSKLQRLTQGKNAMVLEVAAAAHAESGDFSTALQLVERLLTHDDLPTALRRRLASRQSAFLKSMAIRDDDGQYP